MGWVNPWLLILLQRRGARPPWYVAPGALRGIKTVWVTRMGAQSVGGLTILSPSLAPSCSCPCSDLWDRMSRSQEVNVCPAQNAGRLVLMLPNTEGPTSGLFGQAHRWYHLNYPVTSSPCPRLHKSWGLRSRLDGEQGCKGTAYGLDHLSVQLPPPGVHQLPSVKLYENGMAWLCSSFSILKDIFSLEDTLLTLLYLLTTVTAQISKSNSF